MFSRHLWYKSILTCFAICLATPTSSSGPYKSLGNLFQGQLKNLQFIPNTGRAPTLGGQNGVHCCELAVNESLGIEDGNLIFLPGQTALRGNASEFLRYQFPCTASYNGSDGDQPQVWVSYNWCITHCPGWTLSQTESNLGAWVQPFVQYVTPGVVFVLNIPRRRKLNVPEYLFLRSFHSFSDGLSLTFKILAASIIVTFDIVCWLIVILSFSGPILLSGIYEALLDLRLLRFLNARIKKNSLTVRERAHLLYVILLGNLDQSPAWEDSIRAVEHLPNDNLRRRHSSAVGILSPQGVFDEEVQNPQGKKKYNMINYDIPTRSAIRSVKIRLISMLESQASFGSSVGAAIVFFTGSFCYSLIDIESSYGNNGASHRLAFGMFLMIIPHVAVVGSLLLAGSNPHAWAGINESSGVGGTETDENNNGSGILHKGKSNSKEPNLKESVVIRNVVMRLLYSIYRPVYTTKYQPAWFWDRGGCKAMWVAKLIEEYPRTRALSSEVLTMGLSGWILYVSGPAFALLVIPSFFGALVSYTTPAIGLSCRSMVMLIYACSEFLLMLLWIWDLAVWNTNPDGSVKSSQPFRPKLSFRNCWWYILVILSVTMGFFTSIGGTTFFLMGLYTNCLCKIPIQYWSTRHTNPAAQSALSSGNSQQIYMARTFWFPAGLTTTLFLVAVTYFGWWYQRRLRGKFNELVSWIDCINEVDARENWEEEDLQTESTSRN